MAQTKKGYVRILQALSTRGLLALNEIADIVERDYPGQHERGVTVSYARQMLASTMGLLGYDTHYPNLIRITAVGQKYLECGQQEHDARALGLKQGDRPLTPSEIVGVVGVSGLVTLFA